MGIFSDETRKVIEDRKQLFDVARYWLTFAGWVALTAAVWKVSVLEWNTPVIGIVCLVGACTLVVISFSLLMSLSGIMGELSAIWVSSFIRRNLLTKIVGHSIAIVLLASTAAGSAAVAFSVIKQAPSGQSKSSNVTDQKSK